MVLKGMELAEQAYKNARRVAANPLLEIETTQDHMNKIRKTLTQWPYTNRDIPQTPYMSDLCAIYDELCSTKGDISKLHILYRRQCVGDLAPLLHEYTWTADQVHNSVVKLSRSVRDLLFALSASVMHNEDVTPDDTLSDLSAFLRSDLIALVDRTNLQEERLPLETTSALVFLRTTNRILQDVVLVLQDVAKAGMLLVITFFESHDGKKFKDIICGSDLALVKAKYPCIVDPEYWNLNQPTANWKNRIFNPAGDASKEHSKLYAKAKATALELRRTRKRLQAEALKSALVVPSDSVSSRNTTTRPALPPRRYLPPTRVAAAASPIPVSKPRLQERGSHPLSKPIQPYFQPPKQPTTRRAPKAYPSHFRAGDAVPPQQQRTSDPVSPRTIPLPPSPPPTRAANHHARSHRNWMHVPGLIGVKPDGMPPLLTSPEVQRNARTKPKAQRRKVFFGDLDSAWPIQQYPKPYRTRPTLG